jgi:hypothetical protein
MCAMVARDHLPEVEAGNHTATSGGPTGSRSHAAAWPCAPAAVAVVKAIIIIIPSPMRANLYALMQCGEDSEYGRKTYGGYIEVFWALVVEDGESSLPASGNIQSANE